MKLYSKIILSACGASVASATLTAMAINSVQSHTETPEIATTASTGASGGLFTVSNSLTPPTDFTHAAESTINGVVSIKNYASTPSRQMQGQGDDFFSDPLYEFFFGAPRRQQPRQQRRQEKPQEQARGLGSGVIVASDGYIVTNNHVIEGADRLEVTLNDNSIYNATVVGSDPATDVALLKIDAKNLPVIPVGDSDALRVGEWVLAVGNPFGFTSTVTTGIVSAKARSVGQAAMGRPMGIESYIQTDAAVNPGNSGGALVNVKGELVGINTAIYSQTGNYVGYSFAIPSSMVTKVVNDIRQFGAVQRAVIGVAYQELTPQLAKEKNITAVNDGILVGEVQDRSAALEAGIEVGDVIVAINDAPTHTAAHLQGEISKYRPGDKIKVEIVRDNKRKSLDVTLRNSQGGTALSKADDFSALGCAFKELSADTRRQLGVAGGVQVSGLTSDGLFRRSGIKEGFVILDINGVRIASADDVEKVYKEIMASGASDRVMFISGIYPTGRKVYYAVDLSGNGADD